MQISVVDEFRLTWGESLVWDRQRTRLYFVDCGTKTLHWLDEGDEELHTTVMPSMPTGVVPTTADDSSSSWTTVCLSSTRTADR